GQHVEAASHHFTEYRKIHALFWETRYRKRGDRSPGHGPDVVYRIQGRDAAVVVGVVYYGREEVYGLNQGQILAQKVDPGIIGGFNADKQIWIMRHLQPAQHLGEIARRELGRSTRARNHFSQSPPHYPSPLMIRVIEDGSKEASSK